FTRSAPPRPSPSSPTRRSSDPPAVRRALFEYQRNFAQHPPNNAPGAVIDGRDIGTVIAPDATAKLFIDARADVRAHRRWLELQRSEEHTSELQSLTNLVCRLLL